MKGLFDKKRQGRGRRPKEGGLTREIAGIIIGLVAGTVALCWVLNTVFLERYYVMNKENVLLSGFTTIDAASEDGSLDDSSFDVTFDNLCANGNITVMVISPDRTIVRSSVNDTQRMLIEFTDIIFGGTQNETTVLAQAEDYVIQRRTDTRLDAEYLVLNSLKRQSGADAVGVREHKGERQDVEPVPAVRRDPGDCGEHGCVGLHL